MIIQLIIARSLAVLLSNFHVQIYLFVLIFTHVYYGSIKFALDIYILNIYNWCHLILDALVRCVPDKILGTNDEHHHFWRRIAFLFGSDENAGTSIIVERHDHGGGGGGG